MKENACKKKREVKGKREEKRKEERNEKVKVINSSKEFIFHFFSVCTTSALFISRRLIAKI